MLIAFLSTIIDTCHAAGVVAGLHCSEVEMAVHWAERGARLLTVGHDTSLWGAAAAQDWSTLECSVRIPVVERGKTTDSAVRAAVGVRVLGAVLRGPTGLSCPTPRATSDVCGTWRGR